MKINSDFMWSIYLIGVAALFFYFGNLLAVSATEEKFSRKMGEIEEELQVLKKQNQQLSEELTSRGIYSYPQANIVTTKNDSLTSVLITLNGQSPLKDLMLKRNHIYNYSGIEAEESDKKIQLKKTSYLGTLKTHNPAGFEITMKEKEAAVKLEYKSDNDQWTQHIRVRKTSDNKPTTFWVITNKNDEVIDKHVDKGFPTEEDGSILLWKDKKIWYSKIEMNSTFRL
ncbi:hypothetical protein [Salinimicrobium gaetbulicola]|uniref:Uncharacterized protein n=1 Tax=Salinimicrobium gaetbulicola TaxID=999702 RepID=A0ABW3IFF3_9FLAO